MSVGEQVSKIIDKAMVAGEEPEEILFELVKVFALLAYANGTTQDSITDATAEVIDVVYRKADKLDAAGELYAVVQ